MFFSSIGHLVRDTLVIVNSFSSFSFTHIVWQGNAVAHALNQKAHLSFSLLIWMEDVPSDIESIILAKYQSS